MWATWQERGKNICGKTSSSRQIGFLHKRRQTCWDGWCEAFDVSTCASASSPPKEVLFFFSPLFHLLERKPNIRTAPPPPELVAGAVKLVD